MSENECYYASFCSKRGPGFCYLADHVNSQAKQVAVPWTRETWEEFIERCKKEISKGKFCPLDRSDLFVQAAQDVYPKFVTQEERRKIIDQKEREFRESRGEK